MANWCNGMAIEDIPAFNPKDEYNGKSERDRDEEIAFIESDYNDVDELFALQESRARQPNYV